ncbi:MAG: CBS domain-containing protein [Deltaproteobacteria bacterium]|nr:CBS domain-containing protein [Deltaproteobacteria bacterium]MCL5277980.1 CBS domain-containing protein [Deltaproteobacteria bacterium]
MNTTTEKKPDSGKSVFFLSDIIKSPVFLSAPSSKKTGKLTDLIIEDRDKFAEVTHLVVGRPFGAPPLIVPWGKVHSIEPGEIVITIESQSAYAVDQPRSAVLLRDYILDKKVLDSKGREIEVVYDVKLVLKNNRLFITDVDLSKSGLLRRIGLSWLADFINALASSIMNRTVAWSYVEPLPEQIGSFKGDLKLKVLKEQISDIPPVDLADILEELDPEQRMALFGQLETGHASDTLEEIDPNIQRDMIAAMNKERAAQLINEMTPGQAADLLSVLPWWEVEAILKLLNKENAVKIGDILKKQEEKIVNFAASNYLKFSPGKTVLQARRAFQHEAKGKEAIMYLYIIDEQGKLVGVIDIKELLMAEDSAFLKDIMTTNVVSLNFDSTLKQAWEMFKRYGFRALPLINDDNRMLGVVPQRDVMNLTHRFVE